MVASYILVILIIVVYLLILVLIVNTVSEHEQINHQRRNMLIISVVPLITTADIIVATTAAEAIVAVPDTCYETVLVHGRLYTPELASRVNSSNIVVTSASYMSTDIKCYSVNDHRCATVPHRDQCSPDSLLNDVESLTVSHSSSLNRYNMASTDCDVKSVQHIRNSYVLPDDRSVQDVERLQRDFNDSYVHRDEVATVSGDEVTAQQILMSKQNFKSDIFNDIIDHVDADSDNMNGRHVFRDNNHFRDEKNIMYMSPSLMDLVNYGIKYFNVQRHLVTVVTFRPDAYRGVRIINNELNARSDTQLLFWDMPYAPTSYIYKTVLLSGLQVSELTPGIHTISQVFSTSATGVESISSVSDDCVGITVSQPYDYGTVNILSYMQHLKMCQYRLIVQELSSNYLGITDLKGYTSSQVLSLSINKPDTYTILAPLGMSTLLTTDCPLNIIFDIMSTITT